MNAAGSAPGNDPGSPLWFLAELTYRCPLQCAYCSNPLDFARYREELTTDEWLRVLREVRQLGAVQGGFSGGEARVRKDLEILVAEARKLGFYSNLITSGVGLDGDRLAALKEAGLDHVQISFQAATAELSDDVAGRAQFAHKEAMAREIRRQGYPMVLNVVRHRRNLDQIEEILQMAADLGADYVELANTQYHGWAYLNRTALMPSRRQLLHAEEVANRWRKRMEGRMKIYFIWSDYYEGRPKPCMNGWGTTFIGVAPDGSAMPGHGAAMLPGPALPSVREHGLDWIWRESELFNRFRGTEWMQEPCRSCPERGKDFGGCRCQAYLLSGDAAVTDPTCSLSPLHERVRHAVERADLPGAPAEQPLLLRNARHSRQLSEAENSPEPDPATTEQR
ncbi:MAG: pyrroloquinoline quinone biosynthesis protein PqqE [Ectothiorhodospiraceae bacterium]|nr:pyrroloquinoline quinone biosynthesis protein PqqE [Ectothiorhodospiraceae bacterium]